jgi:hypothetical protein
VSEAARSFKLLSANGGCPLGVLKWAHFLEQGKCAGVDACEAGQYYKKFVEYASRANDYRWDGLGEIAIGDGMTLEVSNRAESNAARFGYASEHWKSCATGA